MSNLRVPRVGNVSSAIAAWAEALGSEHVIVDSDALEAMATATFATTQRIPAILRPADRRQVQAVVEIANRFHAPIYPTSRGKNWGLGSRVPASDGCAVLDLARLDRIVELNEELAYVVVEPGVTFKQVHELLVERGSKLMLNVTSGPPESSVLGNALERGHGFGLYADRFDPVCAMEVVLPTGGVIHTGMARFEGAERVAPLHRWGCGPWLDGLFSQSNLGIVTQLTTWLAPRTRDFTSVAFTLGGDRLEEGIGALRELRVDNRIDFQLFNYYRSLARARKLAQDRRLKPEGDRLGLWGFATLHGRNAAEGFALRHTFLRAMKKQVSGLKYLSPQLRSVANLFLKKQLDRTDPRILNPEGLSAYAGVPTLDGVRTMYWAIGKEAPANEADMDLNRAGYGLVWACAAIPFAGRDVRDVLAFSEELATELDVEPQITFRHAGSRAFDIVASLSYDRSVPGEDERMMDAARQWEDRFQRAGYPPYRLGIQNMDSTARGLRGDYAAFMKTLKQALDPNDILAPGRYDARSAWDG